MTTFFRLLQSEDRVTDLRAAVESHNTGQASAMLSEVDPAEFEQVPGSPFAYWVSERVRKLFSTLPTFSGNGRHACLTNQASDDKRYFRCWWEVGSREIGRQQRWVPLSKGGAFCRYHADIHLLIDWDDKNRTFRGFEGTLHRPMKKPASVDHFFRRGITYSSRTQIGFSARILPAECIFHAKGPGVFPNPGEEYAVLAVMNSRIYQALLDIQISFGSYEIGVINRTPLPIKFGKHHEPLSEAARNCVASKRYLEALDETTHLFAVPACVRMLSKTILECVLHHNELIDRELTTLALYQDKIEAIVLLLYKINIDIDFVTESSMRIKETNDKYDDSDELQEQHNFVDTYSETIEIYSYSIGCVFGRWDIAYAMHDKVAPDLCDPFEPLPVCSPGMLTGVDGLPATDAPSGYPLRVQWDGVTVDDPDHPSDIVRRVREVLELIWQNRADAIEKEACEILGVEELRDYFRKPGKSGFWEDHVSRYSKSRRKAPIYWILQSSKKNYAIWLYYHRLDKDLLFKALVNYVEPKIRLEDSRLESLRTQKTAAGDSGREAKRLGKEVERQEEFLSELRDFEDKLRRAANLHLEPDLNDGVVLNIAPLHELVPWKEAKSYWQELLEGKYEWSSIGKQLREKGLVK